MIPYKCPTCDGSTFVSRPNWLAGDIVSWSSSDTQDTYTCGTCRGTGVVWREEETDK